MDSTSSSPTIRESVSNLSQLLDDPGIGEGAEWYDALNDRLEQLEAALDDAEPAAADRNRVGDVRRAHPRLIPLSAAFRWEGRTLLRRASLVVRLSARKYDVGKAPHDELRAATESLIEAVRRYLDLEERLAMEIGHEIGGEG